MMETPKYRLTHFLALLGLVIGIPWLLWHMPELWSADTKVSAMTELTDPIGTDVVYVVDDPGGTAASRKCTLNSLAASGVFPAQPSLLKNGNLDVWQGSTDDTGVTTTAKYVPDMFLIKTYAGTLSHVKRGTLIRTGGFGKYNLELDGSADCTKDVTIKQRIESCYSAAMARMLTYSVWMYNNNLTSTAITAYLYLDTPSASDNFSTVVTRNGSGAGQSLGSVPCATWTKLSASVDCTSFTNIGYGLQVRLWIPAGALSATTKYICMAEAKLEQGSVATPYPLEDISAVRTACERYYSRQGRNGHWPGTTLYAGTGGYPQFALVWPTTMRTNPTVTINGTFAYVNASGLRVDAISQWGCVMAFAVTSTGLGQVYPDSADDYIEADARL